MDYNKLSDIELYGVDMNDYPDFCNAYVVSGKYKGVELTEEQLDELNDDLSFLNQIAHASLH